MTPPNDANQRFVWIVRHGQRMDNVDPRWREGGAPPRGQWDDPPLSARGFVQASEVAVALRAAPLHALFCSPFTRCVQTAQQILKARAADQQQPRLCIEPGLCESLNACQWPPGFPEMREIRDSFPDLPIESDYRPFFAADTLPRDETTNLCCFRRVIKTLKHILAEHSGNVLIVSHGSPIAACHFALSGGATLAYPGQCTISKYRITGDTVAASRTNGKLIATVVDSKSVLIVKNGGGAKSDENNKALLEAALDALQLNASGKMPAAECFAMGDASHLSEREGLHAALTLHFA